MKKEKTEIPRRGVREEGAAQKFLSEDFGILTTENLARPKNALTVSLQFPGLSALLGESGFLTQNSFSIFLKKNKSSETKTLQTATLQVKI